MLLFVARRVVLMVLGLAMAGCAKEDGSRIFGKWRAERMEVMSLKLPLGPELEITPTKLASGSDINIPIASITQHGNEVTLDTSALIGLTFYFVESDRMYFELPVVGRIYYRRMNGQPVAVVAALPTNAAPPKLAAPRVPMPAASPPESSVASQRTRTAEYAQDYAQALRLVQQGDLDGSVRSLYAAFNHGFRDITLLNKTREFDILRSDVRYQVLLRRYTGQ